MNRENSLTKFFIYLVLFATLVVVRSMSVQLIWNWFLTLSLGVRPIEASVAFGFILFVSLFKGPLTKDDEEILKKGSSVILSEILSCIFVISIGWFVHEFVV